MTTMTAPVKRVAVIGAGPSGAITVDALAREKAFDVIRVFERRDQAGGTWVYTPDLPPKIPSLRDLLEQNADTPVPMPTSFPAQTPRSERVNGHQSRYSDTAMHENLHSNITPVVMSYTQEPFPVVLSELTVQNYGPNSPFRHREIIRKWVEDMFFSRGYGKLVEFNTTVELAEKRGDEWLLTLRKEVPGQSVNLWWQETFDALVVASGHFYVPFIPNMAGLLDYNDRFPGRVMHTKHYRKPEDFRGKKVLVIGGSVSAFDALHDLRPFVKGPIYSSLRQPMQLFGWPAFDHPDIVIKKEVSQFLPDGRIEFADGTNLADVDHVIFATGFDFSIPFLPQRKVIKRRIPGLYLHVFAQDDPSLAFIGAVTGGFTFRVFEWQAVTTARLLAGRAVLPPAEEQRKWEEDRLLKRADGIPFFTLAPDYEEYFESLRKIAGDPAPGTSGRVLPKFDSKWLDAFSEGLQVKIRWWKEEKDKALKKRNGFVQAKL